MNYTKFEEILLWVGGVEKQKHCEHFELYSMKHLCNIKNIIEKYSKIIADNVIKNHFVSVQYKL